mmetsp:Transcript_22780/g.38091  ORF Transcript_22780/g.38091 Transcript_22780/m.38091 type:complete len:1002 (-) Transcript_22780:234-3239(-)
MSHFFKEDLELLPPTVFNAAKKGDVDFIFKYFMQNPNGYVNSVGQNGNTMMHVAARHGQAEVISFLRSIHCPENPIDLFVKNNENKLALHLAEEYCHMQVAAQIQSFPFYGPEGSLGTISAMPLGLAQNKETGSSKENFLKEVEESHRQTADSLFNHQMEKRRLQRKLQGLEHRTTGEVDPDKNSWLASGPVDKSLQGYHADGRSKKQANDRMVSLVMADDTEMIAMLETTDFDTPTDKGTFMKYKTLMDIKLDEMCARFKRQEMQTCHEMVTMHSQMESLEGELEKAKLTVLRREVDLKEGLSYLQDALNTARTDNHASRSEQLRQKDELRAASEERARMAELLSDLNAASDPIKEREAKLKEEEAEFSQKVKSLQSALQQKEARMDLMKHLPETCKELQSKLDESSLRLAEYGDNADTTRAATQEATLLRETLDDATEKLEARTAEVYRLEETLEAQADKIKWMAEEIGEKSTEIDELEVTILEIKKVLDATDEEAALEAQCARDTVASLETQQQEELAAAKEDARSTLVETIARLETAAALKYTDLQESTSLKYADLQEKAALEYTALEESTASEYASLKEKTARTTTCLEKTAALLTEVQAQVKAVQAQVKAVEEEKAEMLTKMDERMDYVVELTEDLNQTRAELSEATATLEIDLEKLAAAAENVSKRDRQIEMLRQSLQQMTTHNDLLESDVQKQKKTSDAIAKEMSEARDAVIHHRLELEYLHEKLTATEEELVRTGQTLIEQAKMIASSDIRVMAHATEVSSQRELFQELSKKHAVVVSTGEALAHKLKATKSALAEAEVKLLMAEKYRPDLERFKARVDDLESQLMEKEGIEEILHTTKLEVQLLEDAFTGRREETAESAEMKLKRKEQDREIAWLKSQLDRADEIRRRDVTELREELEARDRETARDREERVREMKATRQELESSADARAREIAADADKRVNAVKKSTAAFKELYQEELDGLRMEMAAERASIQKEMEAVKNAEKGRSWFS